MPACCPKATKASANRAATASSMGNMSVLLGAPNGPIARRPQFSGLPGEDERDGNEISTFAANGRVDERASA
jgi:hypothetical protein